MRHPTRTLVPIVVLLLLMGAFGSGASGQEGQHVEQNPPPSETESVFDEALAVLNSPELASAREVWDSDEELLGQIAYQLRFRSRTDFMSRDAAHLGRLLVDRPDNMGLRSMSLYMTDAEVAEMARRDALGDKAPLVIEAVTGIRASDIVEGVMPDYGPNFGGLWGDQLDGGRMVLAVVDASLLDLSRIEALVGGGQNLKVIEQPFTLNEIEMYRMVLHEELEALGIPHDILAVRSDRGRLLEVRVQDPVGLAAVFVASKVPQGAFSVVRGEPPVPAGRPWEMHSSQDFMPGQMWEQVLNGIKTGSGSTWGFNGHTASYHYMITCGHCMPSAYQNYSNWVGEALNFWQGYPGDSSHDLTLGDTYIVSVYNAGSNLDAARVESSYADDNCYHGDSDITSPPSHCGWFMKHRAIENSWEEGIDRSCASLPSSGKEWGSQFDYQCGYIMDINHNGTMLRIDVQTRLGDSGAGFKWDYRIDGILTATNGEDALVMTAWDVLSVIGFNYNCATTVKHAVPSQWGTCPAVDA